MDVVLSAIDADVIKTYVEVGLGVGIVASMAFDAVRDAGLRLLPADTLFAGNTTLLAVQRGVFLRDYVRRFITLLVSGMSESALQEALSDLL